MPFDIIGRFGGRASLGWREPTMAEQKWEDFERRSQIRAMKRRFGLSTEPKPIRQTAVQTKAWPSNEPVRVTQVDRIRWQVKGRGPTVIVSSYAEADALGRARARARA